MGERTKDGLRLPPWAISMIATLLVVVMGFTIRASARAQQMKSDIDVNTVNIEKLDVEKASKEKVDMTYETVMRIEEKLDDYILNQ